MSTVTLYPGTVEEDATDGFLAWTNPQNVKASDSNLATVSLAGGSGWGVTHALKCTNFGFSIPTGSQITKITVTARAGASVLTTDWPRNFWFAPQVRFILGGVAWIDDNSNAPQWLGAGTLNNYSKSFYLDPVYSYKATIPAITAEMVNAADFGFALRFVGLTSSVDANLLSVDAISVTIEYIDGTPFSGFLSTGLILPANAGADNGSLWTNPSNITVDDSSYCTAASNSSPFQATGRLWAWGFGFNIPSNAVIASVIVALKGYSNIDTWLAHFASQSEAGYYLNYAFFDSFQGTMYGSLGILENASPSATTENEQRMIAYYTSTPFLTPSIVNSPTFAIMFSSFIKTDGTLVQVNINSVKLGIIYSVNGYVHTVNGVPGANIASICGIPSSNISKLEGV